MVRTLADPDDIQLAVGWVLNYAGVFLNSAADTGILPLVLDAAAADQPDRPADAEMEALVTAREMAAIFDREPTATADAEHRSGHGRG